MKDWISVKARLPRQGINVLVWRVDKKTFEKASCWKGSHNIDRKSYHWLYYDVDGSNHLDDSQVSHWKPIIKPIIKP